MGTHHTHHCATLSRACSVTVSYKPPMLVTRVRLPACAFASYSCDSGLNPGLNIFVGRYRFQQWACDCFKIVFCEAGNTRSMHKWADSVKFFDSGFILHRKTTESSPAGNQVLQVFASMRFTNSNCNVVAFASAGATTLASFLATHVLDWLTSRMLQPEDEYIHSLWQQL